MSSSKLLKVLNDDDVIIITDVLELHKPISYL